MSIGTVQIKKSPRPVRRLGRKQTLIVLGGLFFLGAFVAGFAFSPASTPEAEPAPQVAVVSKPEAAEPAESAAPKPVVRAKVQPRAKAAPEDPDVQLVTERLRRSEAALRQQLEIVPELVVDIDTGAAWDYHRAGLPAQPIAHIDDEQAKCTTKLAQQLRSGSPRHERIARFATDFPTASQQTLCHTLTQILQVKDSRSRTLLVCELETMNARSATVALVERALYDLDPSVRSRAVAALRSRPVETYRTLLLNGFRYPWPAVADHAAQALIELQDSASVPALKQMLDAPDPTLPYLHDKTREYHVRELVKVNHLHGCLLCHMPSAVPEEPLRAAVPIAGQALPVEYYRNRDSKFSFVNAAKVVQRQDFSVTQATPHLTPWPSQQRFDYLVRSRPATRAERTRAAALAGSTYPQQQAVRYALFHLSAQAAAGKTVALPTTR